MKAVLEKTTTGFIQAFESEGLDKIMVGEVIQIDFKKPKSKRFYRNLGFHRKFFALLNIGFDAWEPGVDEYKGFPVQKNFKRFRKDIIIAAGYRAFVTSINGEVKAEADSISFDKMNQEDIEKLFSNVIDVLLQYVLKRYTKDDLLKEVENKILGFC